MPVSSSTEHWIKPDALTINLNHFGDPDYLQVSVLAGSVVMAFKQDVIGYNAAHNYRTWPLEAANTYLETSSAYNVYARLTRSEVNARALVIYDPILRDIEGREITYEKNEETGAEKEILGEPNETFYFIFLGQLSSSITEDGRSVLREWTSEYRSGSLETNEQQNDWMAILNKMFRPHYDDPLNPDTLTWIEAKAHMGIAGGLTSFIDNRTLNLPFIYDGLVIDNQTIVWEVVDGVKTLVAKSGGSGSGTIKDVVVGGEGNAITNVELSADKTGLVFTKGLEFAEKSYLDNNFYNKTYIDRKFVTLDTYQSISGGKNFVGGLYVNGGEIKYNGSYWQLDGDLLVTGGITAFADRYSSTSIMDAIVCDEQTITVEEVNGVKTLKVIGGGSGSVGELPIATTSVKGIASFDSNSFNVSSGHVTFNGGKVKVVTSTPSTYESNTLYVIV